MKDDSTYHPEDDDFPPTDEELWVAAWDEVPRDLWPPLDAEPGFESVWDDTLAHEERLVTAVHVASHGVFTAADEAAVHAHAEYWRRRNGGPESQWRTIMAARQIREAGVPIDLHA